MSHHDSVPEGLALVEGRGSRVVGLAHSLTDSVKDRLFQWDTKKHFGTRWLAISQVVTWENVWVEDSTFDGTMAYASEGQREQKV